MWMRYLSRYVDGGGKDLIEFEAIAENVGNPFDNSNTRHRYFPTSPMTAHKPPCIIFISECGPATGRSIEPSIGRCKRAACDSNRRQRCASTSPRVCLPTLVLLSCSLSRSLSHALSLYFVSPSPTHSHPFARCMISSFPSSYLSITTPSVNKTDHALNSTVRNHTQKDSDSLHTVPHLPFPPSFPFFVVVSCSCIYLRLCLWPSKP